MSELAGLAREGKLEPDQMQGGCFSISSLGGIGGTYFTPIINAPEVAIMGVCKRANRAKPSGTAKEFEPRLMLPLSLSWGSPRRDRWRRRTLQRVLRAVDE